MHRQRGQALILTVVCLLVLCAAFFVVFDTGQVVTRKVQLVNAADAAAYSVAIEQARALNTAAYLNRAQVANQVLVAQIVGLQSYGVYIDSSAGRWSRYISYLDWIPYVGEVAAEVSSALKEVQQAIAEVLPGTNKVADLAVNALNVLNGAYSGAQKSIFDAFAGQAEITTVSGVIKVNTLDAGGAGNAKIPAAGQALLAAQLYEFAGLPGPDLPGVEANKGYTTHYEIPQMRGGVGGVRRNWAGDRVASVMMQARDGFSKNRTASLGPLKKAGATDLVDYNRWVAVDTSKFDLDLWLFSIKFTTGMAAAAALPNGNFSSRSIIKPGIRLTKGSGGGPGDYRPGHGYGWDSPYDQGHTDPYDGALGLVKDVAGDPADRSYTGMSPQQVSWMPMRSSRIRSGLQDYDDVAPGKAVEPYRVSTSDSSDVGPIFTVFVQQPTSSVRTGSNIGMEHGDLKLKDKGIGDAMSAVSSAQVYYDRPMDLFKREDRKQELGNLFEPYWQVRLVETPVPYKLFLGLTSSI